MALISSDKAAELDTLLQENAEAALKQFLTDAEKHKNEPGAMVGTLILSIAGAAMIGIFKSKVRKALLGELNAALYPEQQP